MTLRVPPSIDERTVEHLGERDRSGQLVADPDLTELTTAVRLAREESERLVNLSNAVQQDGSMTPEAGLIRTSSAAMKAAERVAARLDASRAKVQAAIAALDKKTSAPPPPTNPAALHLESEIRARLASMKNDAERDKAIKAAANDMTVLGAILRGPAFLSGVSEAKLLTLRSAYASQFHPGEAKRRERLLKALEATERSGDAFVAFVRDMTDSKAAKIAAENARRAEEAFATARGAA